MHISKPWKEVFKLTATILALGIFQVGTVVATLAALNALDTWIVRIITAEIVFIILLWAVEVVDCFHADVSILTIKPPDV